MASKDIKTVLTELGLTETEARVYMAMLELGATSVQNIAKKADISRTAAYDIIAALQEKGLASTFNKGKKKYFAAEEPDQLQRYFRSRVEDMKSQMSALRSLLPEMRLMQVGDRPRVRYYTGVEGLRALYRDIASVRVKEIFEFVDMDQTFDALDEETLLKLRASADIANIEAKVLHRGEVRHPRPKSEYRLMSESMGVFDGIVWIYSNRVAFINLLGDFEAVILESTVFADSMRAMFLSAWNCSKPTKLKT